MRACPAPSSAGDVVWSRRCLRCLGRRMWVTSVSICFGSIWLNISNESAESMTVEELWRYRKLNLMEINLQLCAVGFLNCLTLCFAPGDSGALCACPQPLLVSWAWERETPWESLPVSASAQTHYHGTWAGEASPAILQSLPATASLVFICCFWQKPGLGNLEALM